MPFLPKNYQAPKIESNYFKFQDGVNRIRILSDAIVGWEYWVKDGDKNKPIRVKEELHEIPEEAVPDKFGNYIRHFWAFVVWNYGENKLQVMEITQKSIQDAIMNYEMDADWGDVKQYDFKITRTKENDKVKYVTSPAPKTELSMEIATAYAARQINLEILFDGGNPFEDDTSDIKI